MCTAGLVVFLLAPLALGLQEVTLEESGPSRHALLVPPPDLRAWETTSYIEAELSKVRAWEPSLIQTQPAQELGPEQNFQPSQAFQPSQKFQSEADAASDQGARQSGALPWGVQSPRSHDNLPVFQYDWSAPFIDFPKEIEYSLEAGDTMKSFSSARQDVKLLTQVLENITNGFYLDTHAGDGEMDSNTLFLEEVGWRGLCMEPRVYRYVELWAKFRKAWLFMGSISPTENFTDVGFDNDGNVDMLSGHRIHTYPLTTFLAEMGGRNTIDFWNLNNGGYEAEVLNETLLGSGKGIEFGVILVTFDGRRTGRGNEHWVQMRSRDETEEIIFQITHEANLRYIGGLDAYWINTVVPRYHFQDAVFVNPTYFEKRGLPLPTAVKAAPPPPLEGWDGFATWDEGFTKQQEIDKVAAYIKKSREDAVSSEPMGKAHRVEETKLL